LKRRRAKPKPVRRRGGVRSGQTEPPSEPADDEMPGRSWYASSRDLHDGLVVNEDDDVTLPAPVDPSEDEETPPKKR
jgi:hypothetical protein